MKLVFFACLLGGLFVSSQAWPTSWFYNVWFKAGSDEISDQGRATLKELSDTVAALPRACPIVIIVEGHVDGREALDAASDLDRKRIDAAVSYLHSHDLRNVTFNTHAHGFSKPLVATAVGIPEAQNRLVRLYLTSDPDRASRRDDCRR